MSVEADRYDCFSCPARKFSSFSHLDKGECKHIDDVRTFQYVKAGSLLLSRDDQSPSAKYSFYCVRSGQGKVTAKSHGPKERVMRIYGPGDLVGYGSWEDGLDPHFAEAIDNIQVCSFSKDSFLEKQYSLPRISEGILRMLVSIINERDRRISALETYTVKNRVAALLLDLNERFGERFNEGSKIVLSADRKALAELSGTCSETFSRILTELEADNLIRRDQRQICILNVEGLKKIADS